MGEDFISCLGSCVNTSLLPKSRDKTNKHKARNRYLPIFFFLPLYERELVIKLSQDVSSLYCFRCNLTLIFLCYLWLWRHHPIAVSARPPKDYLRCFDWVVLSHNTTGTVRLHSIYELLHRDLLISS